MTPKQLALRALKAIEDGDGFMYVDIEGLTRRPASRRVRVMHGKGIKSVYGQVLACPEPGTASVRIDARKVLRAIIDGFLSELE